MGPYRKLWFLLIAVLAVTFSLLGYYGVEVYRQAPPIPAKVVTAEGGTLFSGDDILDGQTAWQSVGGMQLGSIWGHGAYQAPDWTADWLHRELTAWLDLAARDGYGRAFAQLDAPAQAALREQLRSEYRGNATDPASNVLTVSKRRAQAIADTAAYYDQLFSDAPALHATREHYAMKENTLPSAQRRQQLTHFFFWTAWAASTARPGHEATYTNNWPHEPLIGNQPTSENVVWSVISVVVLLAGVGFLVWAWAFLRGKEETPPQAPARDPLLSVALTPSQRALGKYLFLVVALFVFQVFLGGFTAHYTVEGQKFYGIDVSQWFPYAL
ncbi:MAG TPA: nitric-oxide reductase large subunit, partial [Pseudorhodoferax sp.]|nr:nitric-oxide reductase large subunit [Pseudorhodoferax sp.]